MLDLVALDLKQNFTSETGAKQSFNYDVRHFYKKLYFNPGLQVGQSLQLHKTEGFSCIYLFIFPNEQVRDRNQGHHAWDGIFSDREPGIFKIISGFEIRMPHILQHTFLPP